MSRQGIAVTTIPRGGRCGRSCTADGIDLIGVAALESWVRYWQTRAPDAVEAAANVVWVGGKEA